MNPDPGCGYKAKGLPVGRASERPGHGAEPALGHLCQVGRNRNVTIIEPVNRFTLVASGTADIGKATIFNWSSPMLKSTCVILTAVVLLAACSISGPRVNVEPPEVEMKPVVVKSGGSKSHCPPGHAKKNWC